MTKLRVQKPQQETSKRLKPIKSWHDIHWDNARFFLTYPYFDCEHDYMYNNICDKLPQKVTFMCVAKERHERVTSTPFHIQAASRICSRNPKLLDIDRNHPNIQVVTSTLSCLQYISKQGNFKDHGPLLETMTAQPQDA